MNFNLKIKISTKNGREKIILRLKMIQLIQMINNVKLYEKCKHLCNCVCLGYIHS